MAASLASSRLSRRLLAALLPQDACKITKRRFASTKRISFKALRPQLGPPTESQEGLPGAILDHRGPSWAHLEPSWAILKPSRLLCGSLVLPPWFPRGPSVVPPWPLEALLGPSWGSMLGSQRLQTYAFRVGETLLFAFGGRLKEEAKPTKAEQPHEEATFRQKVAPRGSRGTPKAFLECPTPIDPRWERHLSAAMAPGSASCTRFTYLNSNTYTPTCTGSNTPWPTSPANCVLVFSFVFPCVLPCFSLCFRDFALCLLSFYLCSH